MESNRCEVCDWPLAEGTGEGCRPGDCRYRPRQGSDEWHRIRRRREELQEATLRSPVKSTPILFSGPMVRAILEGRKTQTRRVVRSPPWAKPDSLELTLGGFPIAISRRSGCFSDVPCRYGSPGDRLWVREGFAMPDRITNGGRPSLPVPDHDVGQVHYLADGPAPAGWRGRPSIHMPRWACRLEVELTAVRVEQLQEISEEDALAEGIGRIPFDEYLNLKGRNGGLPSSIKTAPPYVRAFRVVWESINGKRAPWAENPLVWVLQFQRVPPGHRLGDPGMPVPSSPCPSTPKTRLRR